MIRRGLPLLAWPEPDQIAWAEAIADRDRFHGRGPAAHWAETTSSCKSRSQSPYFKPHLCELPTSPGYAWTRISCGREGRGHCVVGQG